MARDRLRDCLARLEEMHEQGSLHPPPVPDADPVPLLERIGAAVTPRYPRFPHAHRRLRIAEG